MDPKQIIRTIIGKEFDIYALCAVVLPIGLCGSYQLLKSVWDKGIFLDNWVYFHGFIIQNYSYSILKIFT